MSRKNPITFEMNGKVYSIGRITPPLYRKNAILKETIDLITTPEEFEANLNTIILQFCDVFDNEFSLEDIYESEMDIFAELIPQIVLANLTIYNGLFVSLGEQLIDEDYEPSEDDELGKANRPTTL